jgi:hypothetical protein
VEVRVLEMEEVSLALIEDLAYEGYGTQASPAPSQIKEQEVGSRLKERALKP